MKCTNVKCSAWELFTYIHVCYHTQIKPWKFPVPRRLLYASSQSGPSDMTTAGLLSVWIDLLILELHVHGLIIHVLNCCACCNCLEPWLWGSPYGGSGLLVFMLYGSSLNEYTTLYFSIWLWMDSIFMFGHCEHSCMCPFLMDIGSCFCGVCARSNIFA